MPSTELKPITEIFYSQGGERIGPVLPEEFFQLVDCNAITKETMVWSEATQWETDGVTPMFHAFAPRFSQAGPPPAT